MQLKNLYPQIRLGWIHPQLYAGSSMNAPLHCESLYFWGRPQQFESCVRNVKYRLMQKPIGSCNQSHKYFLTLWQQDFCCKFPLYLFEVYQNEFKHVCKPIICLVSFRWVHSNTPEKYMSFQSHGCLGVQCWKRSSCQTDVNSNGNSARSESASICSSSSEEFNKY